MTVPLMNKKYQLQKYSHFQYAHFSVMKIMVNYGDCEFHDYRSSHPEVFLVKGVLKIFSKFTGEHPCRSVITIKLQSNFIEITLRHGCYPVNLLHIFRTPFLKNSSRWLLLNWKDFSFWYCKRLRAVARIWNKHLKIS